MDSSGFRVRMDAKLRQEFIDACRANDRPAAQVLRDFMRDYVARHYQNAQRPLFGSDESYNKGTKNAR
jgi:hypothetical protein